MTGMDNSADLLDAAAMGIAMAVIAPVIALYLTAIPHRALTRHAAAVLAVFACVHGLLMAAMTGGWSPGWLSGLLHIALFVAAVCFWMPALGGAAGLGHAARCVYLFVAGPLLDLPALYLIADGRSAAGLAMIVTMLPIPLAAVASVYLWMRREEAEHARFEG